MEYNVKTLISSDIIWKNNILLINEKDFQLKDKISDEKNEIKTFPLINASLIDNNYDSTNGDSIFIGTSSYNINIKASNKEEKQKIFSSFRKIINNNFSNDDNDDVVNSIDNKYNNNNEDLDNSFELISKKLSLIQNLLFELRNNLGEILENNKKKDINNNINKIQTQLDLTIINFFNYHDLISKKPKLDYSIEEEKVSSIISGDNIIHNFGILQSSRCHSNYLKDIGANLQNKTNTNIYFNNNNNINEIININNKKDNLDINNIIINKDIMNSSDNNINNNIISDNLKNSKIEKRDINNIFSSNIEDFNDKNYDKSKIRKELSKPLTFPPNMIKEMVTNFTQKNKSLPVYFNEPISMGQKQCEKFYYLDLLTKAANEPKQEMQLCYISAFIIGEIFLNIGRSLKPFNPIIGETYEYFNNNLKLRYYSEQVSHKPPITPFVGETPDFACYGDTFGETSFKFFKGGMELSLKNKIHILLKKSGDLYTYIPPNAMAKGLMKPPLYIDYYGDVLIQNITHPSYKCELKFIEEGWTPDSIGEFEGTVYNGDKIIYLLGGNWKKNIYMTDQDGNNKIQLLALDQNLKYLNNTNECYYLPEFTCDLNNFPDEINERLPSNDSRFKKDMRLLEEGNIDEAQKYKDKYESKQRTELNNDQHKILFFKEEYDSDNENNFYIPNGEYWKMRNNNTLKDNCNANIFDVSNY